MMSENRSSFMQEENLYMIVSVTVEV